MLRKPLSFRGISTGAVPPLAPVGAVAAGDGDPAAEAPLAWPGLPPPF